MALIAIASDKGAPGVTTSALALAAVWPRPVLLAECDPSGGDLAYRFPDASGGHLDPRRGLLSLAVTARRGMQPDQVWEHVQKLHGGLDVLAGVTNAEQGAGLNQLWGQIGKVLASLPQADIIADCGRLGPEGPIYDLLAEATTVVLVTRVGVGDVIRLRDRASTFAAAAESRGRRGFGAAVLAVAEQRSFASALAEVQQVLRQGNVRATVIGGLPLDSKGAALLNGKMGGKLGKTALIKTAQGVAQQLIHTLPPLSLSGPPPVSLAGPPPVSLSGPPAVSLSGPPHAKAGQSAPARAARAARAARGRHASAAAAGGAVSPGTGPQASPAGPYAAPPQTHFQPVASPQQQQQPQVQPQAQPQPPVPTSAPRPSVSRPALPTAPPALPTAASALPNAASALPAGASGAAAEPEADDWAALERQRWRERERQQSGGT
jgi:MinD-like ATPase involved in chromosome partitioning or flagellar assembly